MSSDTKNGMEVTALGVNRLYMTAKQISDAGISNMESISELDVLINRFRTEV